MFELKTENKVILQIDNHSYIDITIIQIEIVIKFDRNIAVHY